MDDTLTTRFWTDLIGRLTGPLTLRLYLQPAMAIFFALRDGLRDARAGRSAYGWMLMTDPGQRGALVSEALRAVGTIVVMAILIDVVYQLIVLRHIYPLEAAMVALILAVVPYLLVRGPFNRVVRHIIRH